MACDVSEATDVDGTHLLDQDSGLGAFDFDFGSEGCPSGTDRGGCNQDLGAGEECIGLNDHAIPFPVLFVPDASGNSEAEDVTLSHADFP